MKSFIKFCAWSLIVMGLAAWVINTFFIQAIPVIVVGGFTFCIAAFLGAVLWANLTKSGGWGSMIPFLIPFFLIVLVVVIGIINHSDPASYPMIGGIGTIGILSLFGFVVVLVNVTQPRTGSPDEKIKGPKQEVNRAGRLARTTKRANAMALKTAIERWKEENPGKKPTVGKTGSDTDIEVWEDPFPEDKEPGENTVTLFDKFGGRLG